MSNLKIQQNIPLAPFTTFKIGGPAKFYAEVSDEEALVEALQYAQKNNLGVFVLGGGSNILVSDEGFNGMVIKIKMQISKCKMTMQNERIFLDIWAGNSLADIVKFCSENSLTGLEWAAGIPGSVGGAIRGNAGAYGGLMADSVESVKAVEMQKSKITSLPARQENQNDNVKFKTFNNEECKFGYRESIFKKGKSLIIVSAVLRLQKGDKEQIENKVKEIVKKRSEKLPKDQSAGSFFENPKVEDKNLIERFEKDTGEKCREGKIPAGWLIDEAGLRGKKMGGAQVSEKHANFVVNLENATAQDIVMLTSFVKMKVRDELGVELKEEIQYVGF